jgi:hypothetical protein
MCSRGAHRRPTGAGSSLAGNGGAAARGQGRRRMVFGPVCPVSGSRSEAGGSFPSSRPTGAARDALGSAGRTRRAASVPGATTGGAPGACPPQPPEPTGGALRYARPALRPSRPPAAAATSYRPPTRQPTGPGSVGERRDARRARARSGIAPWRRGEPAGAHRQQAARRGRTRSISANRRLSRSPCSSYVRTRKHRNAVGRTTRYPWNAEARLAAGDRPH